jgi:hypothetical protein
MIKNVRQWGFLAYVPETVPTIRAKKIKTPKLFANIQMTKQKSSARNVHIPAILIRPGHIAEVGHGRSSNG